MRRRQKTWRLEGELPTSPPGCQQLGFCVQDTQETLLSRPAGTGGPDHPRSLQTAQYPAPGLLHAEEEDIWPGWGRGGNLVKQREKTEGKKVAAGKGLSGSGEQRRGAGAVSSPPHPRVTAALTAASVAPAGLASPPGRHAPPRTPNPRGRGENRRSSRRK